MNSSNEKQERFLALFEPIQANLERFVLAMTQEKERARDVIAETVMIAYEEFEKLRNSQAFLSFLFTIATRVYRKEQKEAGRTERLDSEKVIDLLDPGTSPDVAVDIRTVYDALNQLPERQREAVVLFEIVGFSMKEICQIQGGTLTAVKVRVSRGRKRLSEILGVDNTARSQKNKAEHQEARSDSAEINTTQLYSIGARS